MGAHLNKSLEYIFSSLFKTIIGMVLKEHGTVHAQNMFKPQNVRHSFTYCSSVTMHRVQICLMFGVRLDSRGALLSTNTMIESK